MLPSDRNSHEAPHDCREEIINGANPRAWCLGCDDTYCRHNVQSEVTTTEVIVTGVSGFESSPDGLKVTGAEAILSTTSSP